MCHVSLLSMTGTSAEHSDCYGSEETGMVKLLSRAASCSKCGMARYQHIIKPLANTHSLTAQSRRVSLSPSVLDSLASFPWGYIQTSPAKRGDSLYTIMKPRSGKWDLPRSHWSLPGIDATEYWKQGRSLSVLHVTSFQRIQCMFEWFKGICLPYRSYINRGTHEPLLHPTWNMQERSVG